jgi:hypothetical protein
VFELPGGICHGAAPKVSFEKDIVDRGTRDGLTGGVCDPALNRGDPRQNLRWLDRRGQGLDGRECGGDERCGERGIPSHAQ